MRPIRPDDLRSERLRLIERRVEERLERLARDGELSRLPGEGQPLPADEGASAGDRWAAFHLMSANKILPSWAQLRREIESETERLARRVRRHAAWSERERARLRTLPAEKILEAARRARDEDARVRDEVSAAIRELNVKVERFNAVAPVASLQLVPFRADQFFGAAPT